MKISAMTFKIVVTCLLVTFLCTWGVDAHGALMDPVSRSSAWRVGFKTPVNYDDTELYCGGISVQHEQNKGHCGPCGDNYAHPQPRANENGGKYGTGVIVRHYKPGQTIDIRVKLGTNHLGYFEFSLCPLNSTKDIETEECFASHPIQLADGNFRYPVPPGKNGNIDIKAVLPKNFTCKHCVLRWHNYCGNNWGICKDGKGKMGCGPQETFRGCADVAIY